MIKLLTLLALFTCLAYSSNELKDEMQTTIQESKVSKQQVKESESTFQTTMGQYIEEKQKTKPCKGKKNRRLNKDDKGNEDTDSFESLPLTATLGQRNTASIGNKLVTSSVHGANYNYNYKNENEDSVNTDLHSKNCDCDGCVSEKNRKVVQFQTNELGGNRNPLNNANTDVIISKSRDGDDESKLADSSYNPLDKEAADETVTDDISNTPRDNLKINSNTPVYELKLTSPCKKELNFNTRRTNCNRANLTESPTPTTRRILPGLLKNPTSQELKENKLYQNFPQANYNDEFSKQVPIAKTEKQQIEEDKLYQDDPETNRQGDAETERRQNYFPNVQHVSNSYGIDLVHNMNINEGPLNLPEDSIESQLIEPTRGKGIYDMKDTGVMLLENSRVCYACSSMSDPTCWTPDKRTTVKYCKKGHHSCLTKSFKHRGKAVVIRDCGSHCVALPGGGESYSSCSICHSDLCNGAVTISIYSTSFAIIVSLVVFFNTHL